MIIRTIDGSGDWEFGKGRNSYSSGQAAVAEMVQTRLLSFLGDCFWDVTAGINWYGYLGYKDELALNLAVSTCILNTPDQNGNLVITGINQLVLTLNRQSRNLFIQYQAVSIYSTITSTFSYDLGGSV